MSFAFIGPPIDPLAPHDLPSKWLIDRMQLMQNCISAYGSGDLGLEHLLTTATGCHITLTDRFISRTISRVCTDTKGQSLPYFWQPGFVLDREPSHPNA
jgi:hypothetical protein